MNKQKRIKSKTKKRNKPQMYKGLLDEFEEIIDDFQELKGNTSFYKMMRSLDNYIKKTFPKFYRFVRSKIPRRFRIYPNMIFTQCAKTGGTYRGYCKMHFDPHSILNAIIQLGWENTGGNTCFFTDANEKHPSYAIAHEHFRQILGPFSRVKHGATEWTGDRVCFGAYVDYRVCT